MRAALGTAAKKLAAFSRGRQQRSSGFLARNEQHFRGPARQGAITPCVVRLRDDQSRIAAELGQLCRGIQPNAMLALA